MIVGAKRSIGLVGASVLAPECAMTCRGINEDRNFSWQRLGFILWSASAPLVGALSLARKAEPRETQGLTLGDLSPKTRLYNPQSPHLDDIVTNERLWR